MSAVAKSPAVYAEMAARIRVDGRVVGSVRLSVNEWAGLTAREAKALAERLAGQAAGEIEQPRPEERT